MSVFIGLCVFNNAFGLPYVFQNIERIQTYFETKVNIVIAYDESWDSSLGIILSKIDDFQIHILKNENAQQNYQYKIEYICNARNRILTYIRNIKTEPEPEYLIMMDSNDYACIGNIRTDILQEALERKNEWDAISFDREAGYYDYWALSFDPFIYSFFHTVFSDTTIELMKESFSEILETKKTSNELISVYSAFNGFSIYKWSLFRDCEYKVTIDLSLFPNELLEKQGKNMNYPLILCELPDCEHRHFHLQAIRDKNAKIRIYPKPLFALFTGEKSPNCRGPC